MSVLPSGCGGINQGRVRVLDAPVEANSVGASDRLIFMSFPKYGC